MFTSVFLATSGEEQRFPLHQNSRSAIFGQLQGTIRWSLEFLIFLISRISLDVLKIYIALIKGEKEKNIEDVENFQLEFPLVEYHERNWTWLDLALAIKQRCKRVLLQQVQNFLPYGLFVVIDYYSFAFLVYEAKIITIAHWGSFRGKSTTN